MTAIWLRGLVRRRGAHLAGAVLATALAVGFLAALGTFVGINRSHLTARAAGSVSVDWQVQVVTGANPASVGAAIAKLPGVKQSAAVTYLPVNGFRSRVSGATRTTGPGYVVGLPRSYTSQFPAAMRVLLGSLSGPVLLQQTAANLASGPGQSIQVRGVAGRSGRLQVAGVVDLPQEDSFFQTVGAPPGVGPAAPPDNVVLVPPATIGKLLSTGATATPGAHAVARGGQAPTVLHQFHVTLDHATLPNDPAAAATSITNERNHLETTLAGTALVGDNLGAALSAAREDALYGQLLFLLLGLPAFAVALAVTALVIGVRRDSRLREVGLLRLRGAPSPSLSGILGVEAGLVIVAGAGFGWPLAQLADTWAFGNGAVSWHWFIAGAVVVALVVAVGHLTALSPRATERGGTPDTRSPWALRVYLDVVLLAGAALVFWLVARSGYQVVVVPEGVPVTSVNWAALLAPALAWPGLALLVWRVVDATLRVIRPMRSRDGGELVIAALRRRRRYAARGATALAVALGVAGSTAVFTSTYREQSRLDVALTVGSDVAVTLPAGAANVAQVGAAVGRAPQAGAVSAQTHRFAYVGSDLQDLYGVDPATIARATPLQDAFVPGGTIAGDLRQLQQTPDGVLLSAETLHDYQLHTGDTIRLRLQTSGGSSYQPLTFHVIGQVSEWPTAPKDSFIVANAAYVAHATGLPAMTTYLVASRAPATTAAALRTTLGTSAQVNDIASARSSVQTASGLAATDLGGLARLELGFGVVLAVSAFGLALLVGVLERRRALVILAALGASARQRARFLAAEARAVLLGGLLGGAAIAAAMTAMLVKVMTGVFDPPPDHPIIPWLYLTVLALLTLATSVLVVSVVGRWAGRASIRQLRDQ